MRTALRATRALAVALGVAVSACGTGRPEGTAIVVALANSPVNLDPRVGTDEASQKAHQLLYNTLVRIDERLRVVPELASLELEDDVTYVARLRTGVLFHNGRELTSDDVVYTYRSFLDPAFRGRSGAYRQQLASVTARDRHTVEFKLQRPFGSFPINLVMGIVQAGSGDMLRRVYHSSQMPPNGLDRVFYAANPSVDELIDAAASAADEAGRYQSYSRAQPLIAADVPYISLWYKKTVAVFQPDIAGVRLSPIAAFTFLKDLTRQASGSQPVGTDAARK